jgi:hypothetical protein
MIGGLWLLAKYGTTLELETYLQQTQEIWSKSDWAGRQVAAISPRLSRTAKEAVRNVFSANGLLEASGVLSHIEHMQGFLSLDRQLRSYLTWSPSQGYSYPLPKVLVALALLNGRLATSERSDLTRFMHNLVGDEIYNELLSSVDNPAPEAPPGATPTQVLAPVVVRPISPESAEPTTT